MAKQKAGWIEAEIHYGDVAVLKSGKAYREKYRVGHGANGKLYRVTRRAGKVEAKCHDCSVPMKDFLLVANSMKDMEKRLSEVGQ